MNHEEAKELREGDVIYYMKSNGEKCIGIFSRIDRSNIIAFWGDDIELAKKAKRINDWGNMGYQSVFSNRITNWRRELGVEEIVS